MKALLVDRPRRSRDGNGRSSLLSSGQRAAVSPVRYRRRGRATFRFPFLMSFYVNPLEQGRPPASPECFSKPTRRAQVKVGKSRAWTWTPLVLPVLGCLEDVRCMMVEDYFVGRGSGERGLGKSLYCNDYKVSQYGRERAIRQFAQKLQRDEELRAIQWTLSGLRLVCHCTPSQACHADSIIEEFRQAYPGANDRDDPEAEHPK